jgi:hypothetical protein
MKNFLLILALLLVGSSLSRSQTTADSTRRRDRQRVHRLVDENGDGIDDRTMGQQRMGKKGTDKFIDANGDGICDNREGGLGFRRGKSGESSEIKATAGRKGQKGK